MDKQAQRVQAELEKLYQDFLDKGNAILEAECKRRLKICTRYRGFVDAMGLLSFILKKPRYSIMHGCPIIQEDNDDLPQTLKDFIELVMEWDRPGLGGFDITLDGTSNFNESHFLRE